MIDFSKMKTAEQKANEAKAEAIEQANREARKYLADTDWYVTRLAETGLAIPEDVVAARAEARAAVV